MLGAAVLGGEMSDGAALGLAADGPLGWPGSGAPGSGKANGETGKAGNGAAWASGSPNASFVRWWWRER